MIMGRAISIITSDLILSGICLRLFYLFRFIHCENLPDMNMAIYLMVVDTQDMFTMRVSAFSVLLRSSDLFDGQLLPIYLIINMAY